MQPELDPVPERMIAHTVTNARRFYSSKGDPLAVKGLIQVTVILNQCTPKAGFGATDLAVYL